MPVQLVQHRNLRTRANVCCPASGRTGHLRAVAVCADLRTGRYNGSAAGRHGDATIYCPAGFPNDVPDDVPYDDAIADCLLPAGRGTRLLPATGRAGLLPRPGTCLLPATNLVLHA